MRDNLSYYPRLLQRAGHRHDVEIVTDLHAVPEAMRLFVELHRERAASARFRHENYFETPLQDEFMSRAVGALAGSGSASIALLRIDGEVAAAQATVERNGRLTLLYSGFRTRFAAFSPLLILQASIVRQGLERGVRRLDLLPGRAHWQARWRPTQPEPMVREYRLRTRPVSLMRAACYLVCRDIRARLRRLDSARRLRDALNRLTGSGAVLLQDSWRLVLHHASTSPHANHLHVLARLHAR